jgi:DNA-binding CsgD family transcriptional regulator
VSSDVLRPGRPAGRENAGWPEPAASTCPACGTVLPALGLPAGGVPAGHAVLPQPIAAALLRIPDLSPRERTILQLLGFGYDNRSLARVLMLSERTVKRHITAILHKLRLESRLQAGLAALLAFSPPGTALTQITTSTGGRT